MPDRYDTLVVLGPTASGKTALGVRLAERFGGEIISADSRQVYQGLDIGSGKDLDEYSNGSVTIPYHLIDVVGLDYEFNVYDFQKRFFESHAVIRENDSLPIFGRGDGSLSGSGVAGVRDAGSA